MQAKAWGSNLRFVFTAISKNFRIAKKYAAFKKSHIYNFVEFISYCLL